MDPKNPTESLVAFISPYLTPGSSVLVTKRQKPLCSVPEMRCGNKPSDGGNLILTDAERRLLVRNEPGAKKYLRRCTGSEEFINGNMRWCLWLKDVAPADLRELPTVMDRVQRVKTFRKNSTAAPTKKAAEKPTCFFYISQPTTDYILIPEVSSARRRYIPIGFMSKHVISANTNFLIPEASLYLFGVLTSAMHMAWVAQVGGRLKSDYRYSGSMVYNTYPWPQAPSAKQRTTVEAAARAVLDVREEYQERGDTLADLYDPIAMPAKLVKAHTALDRAVDRCYRRQPFTSQRQRVEFLFALYEKLTTPLIAATGKKKRHQR